MKKAVCFFICFIVLFKTLSGQVHYYDNHAKTDSILNKRGELVLTFILPDTIKIQDISRIISIDHVQGRNIRAYTNRKEFNRFLALGINFKIEQPVIPERLVKNAQSTLGTWYPTYEQYDSIMQHFQSAYPSLCQLTEIGKSVLGRSLYYLKISSNVQQHLSKPVVMYSSTMHGDEIAPYAIMLHLIDYILHNHSQPQIKTLTDSCEFWICPLANPDGTYHGGDSTVYDATRYNANNIDLNRNFPDPAEGNHPDGNAWQPENIAVMNFIKQHPLTLSANFHSGSEVVNYPWDTWPWNHPDSTWYKYISGQYADTVKYYGPPNFYTDVNPDGITDGYDWYRVTGGRQDYVNYFMHGREVTIEMEEDKLAPENELDTFWNYHYRSLLNYLLQSNFGIRGRITDKETGLPLKALLTIPNHDIDNSAIYSDSITGMYYRMLSPGIYNLNISAPGYIAQTSENIKLSDTTTIRIDFQLSVLNKQTAGNDLILFPNPVTGQFCLKSQYFNGSKVKVNISDITGRKLISLLFNNAINDICDDITELSSGTYLMQIKTDTFERIIKFVKMP